MFYFEIVKNLIMKEDEESHVSHFHTISSINVLYVSNVVWYTNMKIAL